MFKKFLIKYGAGLLLALTVFIGMNYSFVEFPETETFWRIFGNILMAVLFFGLGWHSGSWYERVQPDRKAGKK